MVSVASERERTRRRPRPAAVDLCHVVVHPVNSPDQLLTKRRPVAGASAQHLHLRLTFASVVGTKLLLSPERQATTQTYEDMCCIDPTYHGVLTLFMMMMQSPISVKFHPSLLISYVLLFKARLLQGPCT